MRQGFSLVELSIVLVILGLLAGGVLSGQALIRAAELRSVTTDSQRYRTAMLSFRDKYMALPGDMANATAFWGKDDAACSGDSGTAATPGTCNGNGDGKVTVSVGSANATGEGYQIWKQLALAGLIEGSYTGIQSAAGDMVLGSNVPKGRMSSSGWWVNNPDPFAGDVASYVVTYGNYIGFGSKIGGQRPDQPALRPEELWNIDTKMDDGKPARGKVIARFWDNACAAADNGNSTFNNLEASYRVSDNSIRCAVYFVESY